MAYKRQERKNTWLGFFNYYLDNEDKAAIRALLDDKKKPSVGDSIQDMVKHGYKVSISENESAGGFVCAVTGKKDSSNEGYTYAVTHISIETAVFACCHVIGTIFEWDVWPVDENSVPDW